MKRKWLSCRLRLLTLCMVTVCLLLSAFAPAAMAEGTPKTIRFSLSVDGVPKIAQTEVTIPWYDYIELGLNSTCTALTATVTPANASNQTVNWTSTDLNTVHINHLGTMTGAGTGVATITAESVMSTTSNPMKDTCRVACGGKFGDANGDGVVNSTDREIAMEMADDGATSGDRFEFIDINGDGIINITDVNLIGQIILGDLDIYVQQ